MIEATVVCDSVSPAGKRLTTFKLRYPKFIHGEFMTHRVISRNASSSRAIPTAKLIEEVRSDTLRAAPVFWGKNQPGMQAVEELSAVDDGRVMLGGTSPLNRVQNLWRIAALEAADTAETMALAGAHKQIVNRLLEPFSHINVVATATEWDNFFGLRLHKDAQPEMRALAVAMWESRKVSIAKLLQPGIWHQPFADDIKTIFIAQDFSNESLKAGHRFGRWVEPNEIRTMVSVARCARVSYESFETGKRSTVEEDLKLYDRLTAGLRDSSQPLHASPMEHQATLDEHVPGFTEGSSPFSDWMNLPDHGNFVGWRQYRKMLPGEVVAPLPTEYAP